MTIRNAIIICETDNNCAGFTYKGPIWDLDEIYDVYFFRWVHIFVLKFVSFVDWKFSRIFCWHLEKFKYLSADRFIPIMKFFLIYLFYISNIDGGYQWLRQIAKYPLIKSASNSLKLIIEKLSPEISCNISHCLTGNSKIKTNKFLGAQLVAQHSALVQYCGHAHVSRSHLICLKRLRFF